MEKSTKKKYLSFFNLLILFVLFCCLSGCGNKEDTTTTVVSGQQIASFTGAPSSLAVGHSSILTVKITDSTGAVVSDATVSFAFVTNNSDGIVVALNGGKTDAGGQALAVYTAGATTPTLSLEDTVQATCGSATGVLILTRTASNSSGYQITLSADVTSLTTGKSSIITVTVTNASGIPASGQAVTFAKLIDQSTMGLITLGTGTTDASGKAVAVYTAGTNNPSTDVQDTIEASISAGASFGAVIITRTGTTVTTPPVGYKMAITADTTSLAAGQSSVITATVTDASGNPAQGLTVSFTPLINNSTMGVITLNSGKTDANGKAVAVYTAGSSLSGSVQDTIKATVSNGGYSSTGAVIITRTAPATTTPGVKMLLDVTPTLLNAGQSSIITVTVTDALGNPVNGLTVNFTKLIDQSTMSLTPLGTTDASGKAVAVYTAGITNPTANVQDTVQANVSSGGYTSYGAVVITRTGTATTVTPGYKMTLTANITSLAAGEHSIITATVTDGSGNTAGGLPVSFLFVNNNSTAPVLSVVNGTTDAAGRISTIYTAGSGSSATSVQDAISATVSSGGYTSADAVIITRSASSTVLTGYGITVTPTPASLAAGAMSVLIAQVYNFDSTPATGQSVTFGFVTNNSGAPVLSVVNGTTNASGQAIAVYTAGNNFPGLSVSDAVSVSLASGEANAAIITRLPAVGTGNRIVSFTQNPASNIGTRIGPPPTVSYVKMLAKVTTDNLTTPVKNKEVTFSVIAGDGTITTPDGTTTVGIGNRLTINTDDNGEAYVHFNIPAAGLGDTIIRAQIEGTTNGGDVASIVYWKGIVPTLTLAVDPSSVVAGGASTITATVTDGSSGNAIINLPVIFTLATGGSGGSLSTYNGTTDGSGKAVTILKAGTTVPAVDSVSASASYLGFGTSDAVSISVSP